MENQKNDNLNLLEAVVQNTEMGKNTLEQIVPMTAASGRNRELLLGQWPAGCKARSRADAAAGCHNPFFVSEEKATGTRPTLGVSRQQHKTPAGPVEPAGVFIWKS